MQGSYKSAVPVVKPSYPPEVRRLISELLPEHGGVGVTVHAEPTPNGTWNVTILSPGKSTSQSVKVGEPVESWGDLKS